MQDLYINEVVKNLKKTRIEYGFRNENWRNTHGVKVDRNQALLCQLPHSPPAHFLYHGSTYFRAFKNKNSVSFGPITKGNLWICMETSQKSVIRNAHPHKLWGFKVVWGRVLLSRNIWWFAVFCSCFMCISFGLRAIWTEVEEKCVISLIGYVSFWARE